MSTNGTSKEVTLEDYIAAIINPRKQVLAQMIADEATAEEFAEAGYLTVHVRDMHQQIQRDVEGVVIPCGACGIAAKEEEATEEAPAETVETEEAPATEESTEGEVVADPATELGDGPATTVEDKTQDVN